MPQDRSLLRARLEAALSALERIAGATLLLGALYAVDHRLAAAVGGLALLAFNLTRRRTR